jgi:magnesium transporter
MITLFDCAGSALVRREGLGAITEATVWIDLLNPDATEEAEIERILGLDVPTRAEMREIEVSSRFYSENGAYFMTSLLILSSGTETPVLANVTFILVGKRLVTVRYSEPKAFQIVADRCSKGDPASEDGAQLLISLLEIVIQRQADHIEKIQDEVENLAPQIFGQRSAGGPRERRLEVMLRTVGKLGDRTSRGMESAVSVHRTLHYFADAARARGDGDTLISRIDSAGRDISSLVEHLRALSGRTAFLLDATLGMIANEQNQIIKLFSVMAVMLMPPTLVASIYGMNFEHMPELHWQWGYPMALIAMLISAVVPFLYFRKKGWL